MRIIAVFQALIARTPYARKSARRTFHFPADIASLGLSPDLSATRVHGLGWISGPLPAILTALCTLPLLIYSLDQEKYRAIKQALSKRRKSMTGEGPHR